MEKENYSTFICYATLYETDCYSIKSIYFFVREPLPYVREVLPCVREGVHPVWGAIYQYITNVSKKKNPSPFGEGSLYFRIYLLRIRTPIEIPNF